jgi:hypothetical protein
LLGEDAVYVIAFNKRLPSELPSFEQIRARVESDYKYNEAILQARRVGMEFYEKITNGIAQGKTFSAVCEEAKIKPVEIPPFSISTRSLPGIEDRIELEYLKRIAFSTAAGKVSMFQMTSDGGIIMHVKARLPLDEAKLKAELPTFANRIRQSRLNETFQEWFGKELERGLRDTPLNRPKTPPVLGSAPAKT